MDPFDMQIRDARRDDAGVIAPLLRRSIAELCVADHHDDPTILARWLANKTPDVALAWMEDLQTSVLVAVEGDRMLGVGSVTDVGVVRLNYVSPDARFQGVSRALLGALERRAAECGATGCRLTSTVTARRFYHACGYADVELPGADGSCAMAKVLRLESDT